MLKGINLKSDFLKYIIVLMSGTAIAQVINLGLSVWIFREYYDSAQLAEFGIFSRVIGFGAALATARYEFALPIAKADTHSFRLYRIALRLALLFTAISCLVAVIPIFFAGDISEALFYGMIPFGIFLTAYYSIGTNWAIRTKQFRSISFSKVANSGVGGGMKAIFGILGFGYIGLILGAIVGLVAANSWFARTFVKKKQDYQFKFKSAKSQVLAKEYHEFPKVNLPHTMMDLGRDLLVVLIIAQIFSMSDLGYYNLSQSMLRMPLMLAGLAISQVFFQNCAERFNKGEDIFPIVLKAVRGLTLISIIPFGLVFFFGDELFAFVFSEKWRGAGEYSEIMAPWFMLNFIASPISFLPLILGKQKQFFAIAIGGAIVNICSFWIPDTFFNASIVTTLWIATASQVAYYLFIIFKTFQYLKQARPA